MFLRKLRLAPSVPVELRQYEFFPNLHLVDSVYSICSSCIAKIRMCFIRLSSIYKLWSLTFKNNSGRNVCFVMFMLGVTCALRQFTLDCRFC